LNKSLPGLFALTGIAAILAAILFGPFLSPPGFSWIHHSTSEQAGQHVAGAWAMRTGFSLYGTGTLLAALTARHGQTFVRGALVLFGLGMIGTAVWSHAPFLPDVPANMQEDWLHSIASSVVGMSFALACLASLFGPGGRQRDLLAWTGLAASVLIPALMFTVPDYAGILQRTMFAISFVFIAREFAISHRA